MQVCVLGAGIVGLACAYELSRRGLQVTVIDRGQPGAGASGANGAQLSYCHVQPLAQRAIWRQLPRLLLARQSPLALRPQWDAQQWRWCLAFLRACNRQTCARSTAQLLQLAAASRAGFEAMLQAGHIACDFSRSDKLVLYRSAAALAAARRQMELQQALGCAQQAVSAQRCVELEPALQHDRGQIAGAIYTSGECALDCLKLCQGLHALLAARGVRFLLDTSVQGFALAGARIAAVRTSAGAVAAQQFVLALGSASAPLARSLGLRLPVYPLKGYSITLDLGASAPCAPRVSVTDAARRVVFARLGARLRVAGMVELAGHDSRIPPARIHGLLEATGALFPDLLAGQVPGLSPGCSDLAAARPWSGLRPATPTGLPLVGQYPGAPQNLLLNTGHGMLGLTLAFGTAAQIGQLLAPGADSGQ